MEKLELSSIPLGETRESFLKVRLTQIREIEKDIKRFGKDAKHFDKETGLRILALQNAIRVVKERIIEIKKRK